MKESSSIYNDYKTFVKKINDTSRPLSKKHEKHMQCRKGCDSCCIDYKILPIEFHFIQEQLEKEGIRRKSADEEKEGNRCIFLIDHSCSIYRYRPVICRTQGLPLLYTNDDFEWELATCELNFREYNYESFTPENTFPLDKYNSRLFMLNKDFIQKYKGKIYGEFERIPIRKLADHY